MKNRLQIRYHIPESLPTRAQAMVYLKETFAIGRTNSVNASLPAEPLVLLYNDTPLDIANGITEAKRLETANVILAIGRGGDGTNVFNNQDYFVIDFAKHEEDITELTDNVDNIFDIINEVNGTIAEMQKAISKNTSDIAEIIKKIGEKGDNSLKDTVYGFIQGAYDAIANEVNRAEDAEAALQNNINLANLAIAGEKERALQAENDLQIHINTEETARIDGDNDNRSAIEAEVLRATGKEVELDGKIKTTNDLLNEEIARAVAKEGELNAKIDDTNKHLLAEVNRAVAAEQALELAIKSEETARRDEDEALQGNINELDDALRTEISDRTTQDTLLSNRIDDNLKQIKENKVSSNRKTITVIGPTENGTNIDVNVDNKTIVVNESGTLSVSSEALVQYTGENAIDVSDVTGGTKTISLIINPDEKILTNDAQGLSTTLSLKWVHAEAEGEKDEIQLIGKGDEIISRIDVADFIKDGILDNVVLNSVDANNPYLSFTFNSAAGKETINVPVKDLVDIYLAGNGLVLNENTFSVKIDNNSEVFLTVSSDGLKLSGIQNAIDVAKNELNTHINNEVKVLTDAIANLTTGLNSEVSNRLSADSKLESEYKEADTILGARITTTENEINSLKTKTDTLDTRLSRAESDIKDLVSNNEAIRNEFKAADEVLRTEFIAADTTIRGEFATADNIVRNEFKSADDAVRAEFATADTQLRTDLTGITNALDTAYKAADKAIEDAYKKADGEINVQIATINGNIETLSTKVDGILPSAQQYTNEKVTELAASNALVEQELRTNIENNKTELIKLTSDVSVDGSIKDIVFDSALGAIVNTITVDDATEQSLVKKFTLEGTPYVYVSNSTNDMKHNGNALNTVIDDLRADINATIDVTEAIKESIYNLTSRIDGHDTDIANINTNIANINTEIATNKNEIGELKNEVADIKADIADIKVNITNLENSINTTIAGLLTPMQEAINALQTELANTKTELDTLKTNAITSITGVANEISVTVTDNTAVVGFAEDAYFVAG
jgi:predicted  nucleic acid-binding Zn-ribbon protein